MAHRSTPSVVVMPSPSHAAPLWIPLSMVGQNSHQLGGFRSSAPSPAMNNLQTSPPMMTPMNVPTTTWRTLETPGAPERRGTNTADSSPRIVETPVSCWGWPATPSSVSSRSLPLRGPLHGRFMRAEDGMSVRSRAMSTGYSSLDVTPIVRERSDSSMSLDMPYAIRPGSVPLPDTPSMTLDHARFVDSQPCTPVSAPKTPIGMGVDMKRNAFCMETLEESPFGVSGERGCLPPMEALMGGA